MSKETDREFEGVELAQRIAEQRKDKRIEGVDRVRKLEKVLKDLDLLVARDGYKPEWYQEREEEKANAQKEMDALLAHFGKKYSWQI